MGSNSSGSLQVRVDLKVMVPVRVISMGQIDLFKNELFDRTMCKKNFLNNYSENVNIIVQRLQFPNLLA